MRAHVLVLPAILLLAACDKKPPEPVSTNAPPPASPAGAAHAASPAGPGEVVWDAPAAWPKAENTSPMRKATYRVPHAEGDADDAELSVSQAGGTTDANIKRWAGQLGRGVADVKREERRAGGMAVTVVEIHGDYAGMAMPGAPPQGKKAGWALLGAIVETSPPTFFKLTGPDRTVAAAKADFDRLVASFRAK
jgi:hypothetical protein